MEFQINGSTWQILELNKETITEWYNAHDFIHEIVERYYSKELE